MAKAKKQIQARVPGQARVQVRAGQLSRERIGEAAFALIDSEGPTGFSARRLAGALKCEAMSLYHHVENMDDVLDLAVDAAFAGLPAAAKGEPRKALGAMAQNYFAMAENHPNVFGLIATRRWRTPRALAVAAASLEMFQALGFTPREALRRARILGAYMNGAGLALAAWKIADEPGAAPDIGAASALTGEAVRADLDAGLKRLLDSLAV